LQITNELLPRGRLTRGGFWLRHLTLVPIALWLAIAASQTPGSPFDLVPVILLTALLVSIWGRRLHDRGRSAWWLLAAAIPVIGALGLFIECGLRRGPPGGAQADALAAHPDYLTV
jgi:uncharacterized membrane protein YhaH (DUF805 family)